MREGGLGIIGSSGIVVAAPCLPRFSEVFAQCFSRRVSEEGFLGFQMQPSIGGLRNIGSSEIEVAVRRLVC